MAYKCFISYAVEFLYGSGSKSNAKGYLSRAGPYIAHLESQYSWAQIRLAAYILGSRPSAQVPEDSTRLQS